eukprot:Hpha_TRINITY_DN19345_c0_g1::TRINITY_DN19345_c0_g1_i1::g.81125::m.81125/K00254/DHODH, pyrD; dihydroorotate dehydrogenase
MQGVASTGFGSFRSGTYADKLLRGCFYTFGALTTTYIWAKDSESSFWSKGMLPMIKLFDVDEEWCLRQAISWLSRGRGPFDYSPTAPQLKTTVFGKELPHPLCLAAGFDRDAEAIYGCYGLGFSAVEIGSVCPQKQVGNGLPRIFRMNLDEAVIHRCGNPSRGMAVVAYFLEEFRRWEQRLGFAAAEGHLLGVNIGRNKATDAERLREDARIGIKIMSEPADYLAVPLPHPTHSGRRCYPSKAWLEDLADTCIQQRAKLPPEQRRPILLKVTADATPEERAEIASVALAKKVDGIIVAGGTVSRPGAVGYHYMARQPGTLGGRPVREMTTELLADLYRATGGKVLLIGSGGVSTGEDALEKIEAGATLVQLYSSLVTRGPAVVPDIKRELTLLLQKNGYADVSDAIGARVRAQTA